MNKANLLNPGLAVGTSYTGPLLDLSSITSQILLEDLWIGFSNNVPPGLQESFTLETNLYVHPDSVPEPSTIVLIALGSGLVFLKRLRCGSKGLVDHATGLS